MRLIRNEEIPIPAWRKQLNTNQHATPFQTPEWYNIFNSVTGLSAHALAVTDDEQLLALAVVTIQRETGIKGFFSRRGIIYGGPLIESGNTVALDLLLEGIETEVSKTAIYIETRNLTNYNNYVSGFENHGWTYIPYIDFQVNTRDRQTMISSVGESRMRQIKKALKAGVFWREATSIDEVKVFFTILQGLYQNKVRKPVLVWDFFRQCYEDGFGKFLLVHFSGEIIGGIFCPIMNDKVVYEFYICGLDNDYKEQCPSVIATWAAMEYASKNNIPVFDFMGAGNKNEDYGVREFKSRFGGELVEFGRYNKVCKPLLYKLGKLGLKAMRHIRI